MTFNSVILKKRNRVLSLTLDRPRTLNALNPEMINEMHQAVARAKGDDEVKALVVRGSSRAFSAGADLKFMQQAFQDPQGADGVPARPK